jgi:hypothetical protein
MATHERTIAGEGDVALDDAGTHARGGFVGFACVFRELQRRAAVADREIGALERAVLAAFELRLQRTRVHAGHQIKRPRADLRRSAVATAGHHAPLIGPSGRSGRHGDQAGRKAGKQ